MPPIYWLYNSWLQVWHSESNAINGNSILSYKMIPNKLDFIHSQSKVHHYICCL